MPIAKIPAMTLTVALIASSRASRISPSSWLEISSTELSGAASSASYPVARTASMRRSALTSPGSYRTAALLVTRLTAASMTPGSAASARWTLDWHAAHVIPLTGNDIDVSSLFASSVDTMTFPADTANSGLGWPTSAIACVQSIYPPTLCQAARLSSVIWRERKLHCRVPARGLSRREEDDGYATRAKLPRHRSGRELHSGESSRADDAGQPRRADAALARADQRARQPRPESGFPHGRASRSRAAPDSGDPGLHREPAESDTVGDSRRRQSDGARRTPLLPGLRRIPAPQGVRDLRSDSFLVSVARRGFDRRAGQSWRATGLRPPAFSC